MRRLILGDRGVYRLRVVILNRDGAYYSSVERVCKGKPKNEKNNAGPLVLQLYPHSIGSFGPATSV